MAQDVGRTSKAIVERVKQSPAAKVKVAVVDIDGVLRGKYVHKDKFLSAVEGGLGFCNVVFGWDMGDVCYDNARYTGWHTGYPDALARIDLSTYREVPWDNRVPFFLADFETEGRRRSRVCPRQLLKKVIARARAGRVLAADVAGVRVVQLPRDARSRWPTRATPRRRR